MSNRLASEHSPYLRQHAENPVDWYPWGEEALARARKEQKPILLSVGYSACHWCHVMAHESFENAATAELMNDAFVCIKVDREERPDVDQLYQGVVQLLGRGGGWPLTVFLLPDLRPFFGGTYFPPTDRYGLAGFPKILQALTAAWKNEREAIEKQAEEFRAGLLHLSEHALVSSGAEEWTAADVVESARMLEATVDPRHGGFGEAPKFPNPMNVAVLLRGVRRGAGEAVRGAALLTLRKMALGGIYDQLGGGFHRYSVDGVWRVPHFEKMLYDNAQLLHLYAEAQQLAPDPLWRKVAEETAAYIHREMTSPEGAFFAAQDADSEGEEGKFFAWTPEEVRTVVPAPLDALVLAHFNVTPEGNWEHGKNVLEVKVPLEALPKRLGLGEDDVRIGLARARSLLLAAREKRVKPALDDKILAGWNGLMIRGLAFAGVVFERDEWVQWAVSAADALLAKLQPSKGALLRVWPVGSTTLDAFLEDYGDLASGLVALYQATFAPRFLEAADLLATTAVARFFDSKREAYSTAPQGQHELPVSTYALHDNATPSGASTLTEAQVSLTALTGEDAHGAAAERYLRRMRAPATENPFAYGHLTLAADAWVEGMASVVVVGTEEAARPLLDLRRTVHAPTVAWVWLRPGEPVPALLAEQAEGKTQVQGKAAAYFCRHQACEAPIVDAATLRARLEALATSPPAP